MSFFKQTSKEQSIMKKKVKNLTKKIDSDSLKNLSATEEFKILMQLAKCYLQLQNWEEALAYIARAELIEPTYEIYILSGYAYFQQDKHKKAFDYFNKARLSKDKNRFEFFTKKEISSHLIPNKELKYIFSYLEKTSNPKSMDEDTLAVELNKNIHKIETVSTQTTEKTVDFLFEESVQNILSGHYSEALETLKQAKKDSGLSNKYPELNKISLDNWKEEFPNLEAQIKEKELFLEQTEMPEKEDYVEIAKMYLLNNDYRLAEDYFKKAKETFLEKSANKFNFH